MYSGGGHRMDYIEDLISVVMPTYKRSEKLSRAIESVLEQSYRNIELLLVNDNEPDDEYTKELKRQLIKYEKDPRFHLVIQEKHINGAAARNVGIKKARGEYIAFLDDDDWWQKDKLEKQIAVLRELDKAWGGVSCKYTLHDKDEKVIGRSSKYPDGYIYKDILCLITDVCTDSLLLRHTALDAAGYFDEELLRHQDFQLLVNFTSKYKLKEVDQFLLCIDVSDTQNRPDPVKLIRFKKAFFKSVKPVMDSLSPSEKKCVYAMHKYELGYVYLKNGDKKNGLKYCLAIFSSPKAIACATRKTLIKIKQILKI